MAEHDRRPSLEYLRRQAKALLRKHRSGTPEARLRAARVLGERARERFQLSDALHVIAVEQGLRSWPAVVRAARGHTARHEEGEPLLGLRFRLGQADWDRRGKLTLNSGFRYKPGQPVEIVIRKRDWRYDIHDDGAAVRLAGRPAGWLQTAQAVVAQEGFNVNRRGVIYVPSVEGRDLALLVWRLGGTALAVYQELLELQA
jgi:hypothetical protein